MQEYTLLISEKEIQARIKELGQEICQRYKDEPLVALCVLKGSVLFFADIVRELPSATALDFVALSSYGNKTVSSGEITFSKGLSLSIEGKHVLVFEDIVDSGLTMTYLKKYLENQNPKSVAVCTLLDKPSRRKVDLVPEFIGFKIPDKFVVGYGLDFDEKYRPLRDVCVLEPWVYQD